MKASGVLLTQSSLPLSVGQWNFNPRTNILSVNTGVNPKFSNVSVSYRFFFSSLPVKLPYDLSSGEIVEWVSNINAIGSIGQQLDDQNTGIVLESSSNIDFINNDGYFDGIFDRLIWENQQVKIYSWFTGLTANENFQLFDGVVESKTFSENKVSFKVKDFVYKLKNKVNLGVYSGADGVLLPSMIGKPKRRVYGKADYVKTVSLDATLNGISLTGILNAAITTNLLTGTGTFFLKELSPGDELLFLVNESFAKVAIESIQSDTALTLGKIIEFNVVGQSITFLPKIASRFRNRSWQIAGHKLRAPVATITAVKSANRFLVDSVLDMFSGDEITVNGIQATIRYISGSEIITQSTISPLPLAGNIVAKRPLSAVYFKTKLLTFFRDYTITNLSNVSKITLNELAEFNVTEQVGFSTPLTFVNGSRSVTTSAAVDLRTVFNSRDWIRSANISKPEWYEILDVSEQLITLRTAFTGTTATETAYYKNIEYAEENSLITVSCMGMDRSGPWVKTASDAVADLILNDAGFATINNASFAKANADCDYVLSVVIPENVDGEYPLIRDVITLINESVMGSLYGDSSQNISYSIFNSTKPESMVSLTNTDILSFTVQTNQQIINEAKINYSPYIDIFSEMPTFKTIIFQSSFVDKYVGIKNSTEKTIYLYEDSKALIIAQRICFFKSLSNSSVTVKAKMNLAQVVVNDKMYLSLDRLFTRFAGAENKRAGVVSSVKRDGYNCEIVFNDLGNIYNRVMSIAPNTTLPYSSSVTDDRVRWGYILDDDTETPNALSEIGLGSNLIG